MDILQRAAQLTEKHKRDLKNIGKDLEGRNYRIIGGKYNGRVAELTDIINDYDVLTKIYNKRGSDFINGGHSLYLPIKYLSKIH